MSVRRILIVEDDPMVSMHIEALVAQTTPADIVVTRTVAEAEAVLDSKLDFAFLDVEVLDGTTYAFASSLISRGVPFAFVSASNKEDVPLGLQTAPFVPKPYNNSDIVSLLTTAGA